MMKTKSIILGLLMMFSLNSFAQNMLYEKLDIKMFPQAKEGYEQVYIQVPKEKNETNFRVEIFVGKEAMLDCNSHFLMGEMEEKNLNGWGYQYYEVKSKGDIGGTMMACPDMPLKKKFVHLQPQLLRYNSKLPIVIYIPKCFIVKYKIFKAQEKMMEATTVDNTAKATKNSIDYTYLKNYFVKNDIERIGAFKIKTQKELDKYFGAATVMGKDGKPTKVDFSKQQVIANILNATNKLTELKVISLSTDVNKNIQLNYSVTTGAEQSFTLKPYILLALDKKHTGKIILKEQ